MNSIYENRKPSNQTVSKPSLPTGQYWDDKEFTRQYRRGIYPKARNPELARNTRDYFQTITEWTPDWSADSW
ncbi:MAG: hypothetical protein J0M33_23865 [Anaerolineae bacterium]|nr:hypothetical protein [Anaerolineae bacterium]